MCTSGAAKLLSQLNRFQVTISWGIMRRIFSPACGEKGQDVGGDRKIDGSPTFQLVSLHFRSRRVISLCVNSI